MNTQPFSKTSASSRRPFFLRRVRRHLAPLWSGALGLALGLAGAAWAANIAPLGTGILGVNDAIDADAGTPRFHVGTAANINDGYLGTRVDNWFGDSGGDLGQNISFVGVVWPTLRYERITTLSLTLATFYDGGWFGYSANGPGWGGTLYAVSDLLEPTLQVSTDGGVTWTTVGHTSDYLTALDGHGIGGTGGVNPTSVTAVFTLDTPATEINGLRIIGENGGTADGNGFIGVAELMIEGLPSDSDNDGMPDAWEQANGLNVGVNDAAGDLDTDGLTNLEEYQAGTKPNQADTDGDGLTDGYEVKTSLTNPALADTDGDGLTDGAEVNTHKTNPTLSDTDADGLSDSAEINTYGTKPLVRDTDADAFSDGIEVAQGTDPKNPASYPSNAALIGTAIMGFNDAIDTDAGTSFFHYNAGGNINDGNLTSSEDNWSNGTDQGQINSFVGITWPAALPTQLKSVTLTLATFTDGGWFGPAGVGPGVGGYLDGSLLLEPTVQVLTGGGTTWTTVAATSDYLTALDGHSIGGGGNPNPTSVTTEFTLTSPITGATGIRLIGENGGNAGTDPNGFIGVFEMVVTAGIANDSDNDGLDDDWERSHGLQVGTNDSAGDPDADGLSNIQEFAANTDPQKADTDGDGLKDGAELGEHNTNPVVTDTDGDGLNDGREVNTVGSDPLAADTDGDGLSDGQEVDVHHCDPTKPDTDGDGYNDGVEVANGSDPNSAASRPDEVAMLGQAILGVKEPGAAGLETPYANAGVFANINDGNLTTRVDTWGGGSAPTASYVGILWSQPMTDPVARLEVSLAVFFDGGWFGPNGIGPGSGGVLSANSLTEPVVQVTTDHGVTWTTAPFTSDYLTALDGHPLPAVDFGAPTTAQATFALTPPRSNIDGVRLLGSEGGTASAGFLGVFELSVKVNRPSVGVTIGSIVKVGNQFKFEFDSRAGATYLVEYKPALTGTNWQTLATIPGDGTRKQVSDTAAEAQRFYRVKTQ